MAPSIPVDGCGKPLDWYTTRDTMPWVTLPYSDRVVRPGRPLPRGPDDAPRPRRTSVR